MASSYRSSYPEMINKEEGSYIENKDSIDFDDLVGMKFKLVHNSDYYEKLLLKHLMT